MIEDSSETGTKKNKYRKRIIRWKVWLLLVAIAAILLSLAECYHRTTSCTYHPVNIHYENSEGTD